MIAPNQPTYVEPLTLSQRMARRAWRERWARHHRARTFHCDGGDSRGLCGRIMALGLIWRDDPPLVDRCLTCQRIAHQRRS
jgi:hypothetical protein